MKKRVLFVSALFVCFSLAGLGCSTISTPAALDDLCQAAQQIESDKSVPPESRGTAVALYVEENSVGRNPDIVKALGQAATRSPGEKSRPFFELADRKGLENWECAALQRAFDGPPRVSQRSPAK